MRIDFFASFAALRELSFIGKIGFPAKLRVPHGEKRCLQVNPVLFFLNDRITVTAATAEQAMAKKSP